MEKFIIKKNSEIPMTKPTRMCIKKDNLIKYGYKDLEDWLSHDNHVYIGRDMSFYVKGVAASDNKLDISLYA